MHNRLTMTDRDWTTPLGTIPPTRRQIGSYAYLERYFLSEGDRPEIEVDQGRFVQAERNAGFRPKPGCGPAATGGFSNGRVSGRVESVLAPADQ